MMTLRPVLLYFIHNKINKKTNIKQLIHQANSRTKKKILLYYVYDKINNKKSNITSRKIKNKSAYILEIKR